MSKKNNFINSFASKWVNKNYVIEWITWLIYVEIFSVLIFVVHEPWRDEVQSWLLVRDQSLFTLFKNLHYEGHPAVWFLILYPFVKLGFPFAVERIINHMIAAAATWIMLFKSPFNKVIKILLVFNVYFLFEYNAIARNYALIWLFMMIIASIFKQRFENKSHIYGLMLFFLANTHIYAGVFVVILCMSEAYMIMVKSIKKERVLITKQHITVFAYALAGLILLYFTMSGDRTIGGGLSNININYFKNNFTFVWKSTFYLLGNLYINIMKHTISSFYLWIVGNIFNIIVLLSVVYLILLLRSKWQYTLIIVLFSIIITCFLMMGYPVTARHYGILFLVIVMFAWITIEELDPNEKSKMKFAHKLSIAIACLLLINMNVFAFKEISNDIKGEFSSSREAAKMIIQKGYDKKDTVIVAFRAPLASSIIPYLKNIRYFDYLGKVGDRGSFIVWDEEYQRIKNTIKTDDVFNYTFSKYGNDKNPNDVLVILTENPSYIPKTFQLIGCFNKAYSDENYQIFKLIKKSTN